MQYYSGCIGCGSRTGRGVALDVPCQPTTAPTRVRSPYVAPYVEPCVAPAVHNVDTYTGCRAYGNNKTSVANIGRRYTKIPCP